MTTQTNIGTNTAPPSGAPREAHQKAGGDGNNERNNMESTTEITYSFIKKTGALGIRVKGPAELATGSVVRVTKKNGKTENETVGGLIWRSGEIAYYEICRKYNHTGRPCFVCGKSFIGMKCPHCGA